MGKISRFGLMELSRQRLRPALNEGSHVTCPRCNGVGVIRDTESSALHILRILQEEAMKEGTAAIHAQVPVEVGTFLLNEKRVDIAKLEARLRVSIVLIPNKFLETPHYKVERLRHDDERLEPKASFERAEAPATEIAYGAPQADGERPKPKQEAVVRGIVPQTPAPVVAPPPVAAPAPQIIVPAAEASLWTRVKRWITGEQPPLLVPAAGAAPAPAPAQREGRERPGRDERRPPRRDRGGRDEKQRDRGRDGKRDGQRDGQREAQADTNRGEGRRDDRPRRDGKQRPPAETQADGQRDTQQTARQGDGRGEESKRRDDRRRERGPRPPKDTAVQTVDAVAEDAVTAPVAVPQEPSALVAPVMTETSSEANAGGEAAATAEGEERRGRRRRRRRGGGRGEGAGARGDGEAAAGSAETADADAAQPAENDEQRESEAPAVEATSPVPIAPSVQMEMPVEPERPVAPVAPVTTVPARAPVSESQPVHASAPIARAPAITAAAPTVTRVAEAPLPLEQLLPLLESAGMTLAQTNADKLAQVQARIAAEPRPQRVPRSRPELPPLDTGPLVQVATRRSNAAPPIA
jgi:ribonuclease E